MKKKRTPKRLSLHRETLHKLEDDQLPEAVGGATVGGTCCARSDSCPPPPTGNGEYTCLCGGD